MPHATRLEAKPKSAIEIYFDALQLNYLNRRIQLETVTWFLRDNPATEPKGGGQKERLVKAGGKAFVVVVEFALALRASPSSGCGPKTTSRRSFEEASIETSGTLFFFRFLLLFSSLCLCVCVSHLSPYGQDARMYLVSSFNLI